MSSFQDHEVVKTTETQKIEPDKKSDLVPLAVPDAPRVTKPKQDSSARVTAEPSKKPEPALFPTKKHDTSPVLLEAQKADVIKIPELTLDSKELGEVQLVKKSEPTPVFPDIQKPARSSKPELPSISKAEPVIKETPKVEPEPSQITPELPLAKPEPIPEKEQTPVPKKKSPPKRGIIFFLSQHNNMKTYNVFSS